MTALGNWPLVVLDVAPDAMRASVESREGNPRWVDYSALYDATGLLSWRDVYDGTSMLRLDYDYVMPGGIALPVQTLYVDERGRECVAVRGSLISVRPDAPRFLRRVS